MKQHLANIALAASSLHFHVYIGNLLLLRAPPANAEEANEREAALKQVTAT